MGQSSSETRQPADGVRRAPRLRRLIPEGGPSGGGRAAAMAADLLRAMRPKQWVKNFACFAGLIFSGQAFHLGAEALALVAFAAFCLLSSSIYLLNDCADRERDRRNPRTASRPIASGRLPIRVAIAALVLLFATAETIAATLGRSCAAVVFLYFATNVLYTFRLKRVVIVDVMCIALGFVLRVVFGVYAVGVMPTAWIALCMFFLALFLGFAKRRGEICNLPDRGEGARLVLTKYSRHYLETLLTISATLAILCYAMFTAASHRNPTLIVTVAPVVFCVYRYFLQVLMHDRGESPDAILTSDRRLWAGIAIWLASYVAILYGDIRIFAELS